MSRKMDLSRLTPLKAIKKYCLECSGDSYKERKGCAVLECLLHPYRLGHNPKRKGHNKTGNLEIGKIAKNLFSKTIKNLQT